MVTSTFTTRPVIQGLHGVVSAGHYLGAITGFQILERGGNAFDAAAAVGFALAVLEPHQNSVGGEVPILACPRERNEVLAISGQGQLPHAANIAWFRSRGITLVPGDGFLPAVVPSVVGTWIEVLKHFGTMRLRDVIAPAVDLAENGFPMYYRLRSVISENAQRFASEWKTTAATFLPDGKIPEEGHVFKQPQLARTFRTLIEAEARKSDRKDGLEAARKEFYEGKIALLLMKFLKEFKSTDSTGMAHESFLELEDLSSYRTTIEDPVSTTFSDYEVFKCGPWTQGPVFLQQLNLLESLDIKSYEHNTADYIHAVVEAAKLAFADRDAYYGDPNFASVPISMLVSKEHARKESKMIDMKRVSFADHNHAKKAEGMKQSGDTTHLDVIDKWGNMVSATQSGGWIESSPLIAELGFALSTRAQMFDLDHRSNNALMPGKRPRTTLTPSLAFKNGRPFMAFGTPGGDQQDQWTLQFFLNYALFGMNLQEAIDSPSFHALHLVSSFYPRDFQAGRLVMEDRIPKQVIEELERRGHLVEVVGGWENGKVCAVARDPDTGVIFGASSPKTNQGAVGYTVGW
jgi:gamma-glutamyltranspeptidase / glutathione hydrolase